MSGNSNGYHTPVNSSIENDDLLSLCTQKTVNDFFEKAERTGGRIVGRRNRVELVLAVSTIVFAILTAGAASIFLDRKPYLFSIRILTFLHKSYSSKNILITNIAIGAIATFGVLITGGLAVAGVYIGSIIHLKRAKRKLFPNEEDALNLLLYQKSLKDGNDENFKTCVVQQFHMAFLYFNEREKSAAEQVLLQQPHNKKYNEIFQRGRIIQFHNLYNFIREKIFRKEKHFKPPLNLRGFFILISLLIEKLDLKEILKLALVHEIIVFSKKRSGNDSVQRLIRVHLF